MEQIKEWKNTLYLGNSNFKDMEEFLPYRENTFSWITKKNKDKVLILTPNHNYICTQIKRYTVQSSTDSLYLLHDELDGNYFVIRLEDDDYE